MSPASAAPRRTPASGILAVLVLTAGFTAAYVWLSLQSAQQRTQAMMHAVAETTAASVDTRFLDLSRQLDYLGRDLLAARAADDWTRAAPFIERVHDLNPGINPVNVTRPDGQILATTEKGPYTQLPSIGNLPSFKEAMRAFEGGAAVHISRPFQGVVTRGWLLAVRRAVRDHDGRILFTVGAGLPLSQTQVYWNQALLPEGAALGIYRDDGYFLSRYPLPQNRSQEELYGTVPQGPLAQHLAANPAAPSGWVSGKNYFTGAPNFYAYVRLRHFPLTVFMANPEANLWRTWWNESFYYFALLLAFYLLAALLLLRQRRQAAEWERTRNVHVEELEAINKELEAFTYTVAHDLRAPLRAINGFAGLLAAEPENRLTAESQGFIERLRQASERMGHMIDKLLEFARQSRQAVKPQIFNMQSLVRQVIADLKPAAPGATFSIATLPDAKADPELIRVVWENLIDNAIKYSREASHPTIDIGYAGGRYYVRDNGTGFDMQYAAKLFEVFTRLDPNRFQEGFGIGLATVAKIINRHGGTVEAEGVPGEGAAFYFSLP